MSAISASLCDMIDANHGHQQYTDEGFLTSVIAGLSVPLVRMTLYSQFTVALLTHDDGHVAFGCVCTRIHAALHIFL